MELYELAKWFTSHASVNYADFLQDNASIIDYEY